MAVSAVLIGIVLVLHFGKEIRIGVLTRDPNAIGRLSVYEGFLSQIGIFFWSAAAAICFFSVTILSRVADCHKLKRFLLISGLLTLLLGLDDVFLLHEVVFPHFGIPQNLVLGSYFGFMVLYLIMFYSLMLETEYVLMAIALFFFGISVFLDVLHLPVMDEYYILFEDGAKLIGIVSWLAYFFRVGASSINRYAAQQSAPPDHYSTGAP